MEVFVSAFVNAEISGFIHPCPMHVQSFIQLTDRKLVVYLSKALMVKD